MLTQNTMLRISRYRNEQNKIIGMISLLVLLFICVNYHGYHYTCGFIHYSIDYHFQETEQDIQSDVAYAKSLVLPTISLRTLNENNRNQLLHYQKESINRSKILAGFEYTYLMQEVYITQANCPMLVHLGAVEGSNTFGVCNPWVLANPSKPCVVYSFGLKRGLAFEEDLYQATDQHCDIFCFDNVQSSVSEFTKFKGHFMKSIISDQSDHERDRRTIVDLTEKFGHKKIDILKMDMNGEEFSVLPSFLRRFDGVVCQIVLVMHSNDRYDGILWLRMYRMLERRGYRLFHRQVRTGRSRWLHSFVYSYIHLTCLKQFELGQHDVLFTYFDN